MLGAMGGHAQRRSVGIKDVAKAAGVSTTTVSHALNDKGRLPAETRERVRRIADELGYRPSAIARGLVSGKTGVLGLAVSVPGEVADTFANIGYFSRLINGATAAATSRGHALVVVPARGEEAWERLPVDGALIVDPIPDDPHPIALRAHNVPYVTVGREPGAEDGWWVDNDFRAAVRMVLDHMVDTGASRPALITWEWHDSFTDDVDAAYRAWCEEAAVPLAIASVSYLQPEARTQAISALFDALPPPDSVFVAYERLLPELLRVTTDRGIAIPDELRVASSADTGIASTLEPAVTTLDLDPEHLGSEAIGLLLDRVADPDAPPQHRIVDVHLFPRTSTIGVRAG
jgi:DNA-binding LacI/PurR family transcriptional regulator